MAPKLVEWRERWSGTTPILLLPRTTEEVIAKIWCAQVRRDAHAADAPGG